MVSEVEWWFVRCNAFLRQWYLKLNDKLPVVTPLVAMVSKVKWWFANLLLEKVQNLIVQTWSKINVASVHHRKQIQCIDLIYRLDQYLNTIEADIAMVFFHRQISATFYRWQINATSSSVSRPLTVSEEHGDAKWNEYENGTWTTMTKHKNKQKQ